MITGRVEVTDVRADKPVTTLAVSVSRDDGDRGHSRGRPSATRCGSPSGRCPPPVDSRLQGALASPRKRLGSPDLWGASVRGEERFVAEQTPSHHRRSAVDYEQVDEDYMEKRQLQRGAAGWVLLAGLGRRLRHLGRLRGLELRPRRGRLGRPADRHDPDGDDVHLHGLRARRAVLDAARPAGGGYGFARRALGPLGRLRHRHGDPHRVRDRARRDRDASSAATSSRSDIFGITDGWPVYLAFYAVFVGIHLLRRRRGAQADLRHHRDRGRRRWSSSCSG